MEGSARGSHRGDEQAQPGTVSVPAPQAPSCRKQPGIPAPPCDLLLWNNSTEGLEDGTGWERRPWVCVLPFPRSLQQGSLRALPSPRELVLHLSRRALGLFLGILGKETQHQSGFPSCAALLWDREMLPWPAVAVLTSGEERMAATRTPSHRDLWSCGGTHGQGTLQCCHPSHPEPKGDAETVPLPGLTPALWEMKFLTHPAMKR